MLTKLFGAGGLLLTLAVQAPEPPATPRSDAASTLHGRRIDDPYRWLEDHTTDQVRKWADAQTDYTRGRISNPSLLKPAQAAMARLAQLTSVSSPFDRGSRMFYQQGPALASARRVFVKEASGQPKVILDPEEFAAAKRYLTGFLPSPDGQYITYGLGATGSDWCDWHVREVASGKDTADVARWTKMGVAGPRWAADSRGFYYKGYDPPAPGRELEAQHRDGRVLYHQLGTPSASDVVVARDGPDTPIIIHVFPTLDGRSELLSYVTRQMDVRYRFRPAGPRAAPFQPLFTEGAEPASTFLGSVGSTFYFLTDLDAPNKRIVAVDGRRPRRANWRVILKEGETPIEEAEIVGARLFVTRTFAETPAIEVYDLDGRALPRIALPGVGAAENLRGRSDGTALYFEFSNYVTPGSVYRYDLAGGAITVWQAGKSPWPADAFDIRVGFAVARDGTRVPYYSCALKDLKTAEAPTLLHVYGAYGVSRRPVFFPPTGALFCSQGFVFVEPCVRGGSEFGRGWWEAGRLLRKQTSIDDVVAVAEHLVATGRARKDRLGLHGISAGGLLAAATAVAHPDLFRAVLPMAGIMDLVRFNESDIGKVNANEFGDPQVKEQFDALIRYSPLQNVRPGVKYPPMLVIHGQRDDRVLPWNGYKFAAALQGVGATALLYSPPEMGHDPGQGPHLFEMAVLMSAFLHQQLE